MRRCLSLCAVAVAALTLHASPVAAQQPSTAPTLTRTVLLQRTLTVPGRDGVLVRAELAPGASAPRHTHPGEEFGYVLDGTVRFEVAGQPAMTLAAGDAFYIPPNTPHVAHNTGTTPWKAISTYVVESGKPLAIPAP